MSAEDPSGTQPWERGAVFVWIHPLKRNSPTLGGCKWQLSVQMASSKKAMLNGSKGASKHWWLFRGPVSFSTPSQTYKDYSCVHDTGCHTYTLWINRYYFHLVKGKRQGWSNIGVVVTVRMFPPLHVFGFRVRQRSCCYPKALDFAQIQSPFAVRRSLLPAGERPLLVETDRVDQSGRTSLHLKVRTLDLLVSLLHSFSGFCMYFVFLLWSYF